MVLIRSRIKSAVARWQRCKKNSSVDEKGEVSSVFSAEEQSQRVLNSLETK